MFDFYVFVIILILSNIQSSYFWTYLLIIFSQESASQCNLYNIFNVLVFKYCNAIKKKLLCVIENGKSKNGYNSSSGADFRSN
jgi:hypothetical protein